MSARPVYNPLAPEKLRALATRLDADYFFFPRVRSPKYTQVALYILKRHGREILFTEHDFDSLCEHQLADRARQVLFYRGTP